MKEEFLTEAKKTHAPVRKWKIKVLSINVFDSFWLDTFKSNLHDDIMTYNKLFSEEIQTFCFTFLGQCD